MLMNVPLTMEAVLKPAPTLLDHSPVAATLGTYLTMMQLHVMVSCSRCKAYGEIFTEDVCP